jgi:hypothetical protein
MSMQFIFNFFYTDMGSQQLCCVLDTTRTLLFPSLYQERVLNHQTLNSVVTYVKSLCSVCRMVGQQRLHKWRVCVSECVESLRRQFTYSTSSAVMNISILTHLHTFPCLKYHAQFFNTRIYIHSILILSLIQQRLLDTMSPSNNTYHICPNIRYICP